MDVVARHRALSRHLYVDGAFRPSDGQPIPVLNPATEDVIGEIAETTAAEIEEVIGLAEVAQKSWWARAGAERADIMHEVTRDTRDMNAVLAESLTREQGKTYKEAMDEIGWCASAMSYYAEISRQEGGRVHGPSAPGSTPLDAERTARRRRRDRAVQLSLSAAFLAGRGSGRGRKCGHHQAVGLYVALDAAVDGGLRGPSARPRPVHHRTRRSRSPPRRARCDRRRCLHGQPLSPRRPSPPNAREPSSQR